MEGYLVLILISIVVIGISCRIKLDEISIILKDIRRITHHNDTGENWD